MLVIPRNLPFPAMQEFQQAYQIFLRFSPQKETVETCIENMQKSFSTDTRIRYEKPCVTFIQEAHALLRGRIGEIVKKTLIPETRIPNSLGPLRSIREERIVPHPYLESSLQQLLSLVPEGPPAKIEEYFSNARQSLDEVCSEYRAIRQQEHALRELVGREIACFLKRALESLEKARQQIFYVMKQFETMQQQVPGFNDWYRASSTEFTLEQKERLLWIFHQLRAHPTLSQGKEVSQPCDYIADFFINFPRDMVIIQKQVQAVHKQKLPIPWKTPSETIDSIFSSDGESTWEKVFPQYAPLFQKIHALQVLAREKCETITAKHPVGAMILKVLGPLAAQKVLAALPLGTLDDLKRIDLAILSLILEKVTSSKDTRARAHIIRDSVELCKRLNERRVYPNKLKNRDFSDEEQPIFDSKKTDPLLEGYSSKEKTDSSVCLGIHQEFIGAALQTATTLFINLRNARMPFPHSPFLVLAQLPEEELGKTPPYCGTKDLQEYLRFFLHGGKYAQMFIELSSVLGSKAIREREFLSLLSSLLPQELAAFISFCRILHTPNPGIDFIKKVITLVKNAGLSEFARSFLLSGAIDHTDHAVGALQTLSDIESLYSLLQKPVETSEEILNPLLRKFFFLLDAEELYQLTKIATPRDQISFFYYSELTHRLEEDISSTPLSLVPTEILVRFFWSKSFPEIRVWLLSPVPQLSESKTRLETISHEQRNIILSRFPRENSFLPSPEWLDLFHVSEAEAKDLCRREEPLSPEEFTPFHTELQACVDSFDPLSILNFVRHKIHPASMKELIIFLLESAQVTTICGGRTFLSWGNLSSTSTSCSMQDSFPLHVRHHGQHLSLFPQGLFSDAFFGVAVRSLREKLLKIKEEGEVVRTSFRRERNPFKFSAPHEKEMTFELLVLEKHLKDRYPEFSSLRMHEASPTSSLSTDAQFAPTFLPCLKLLYTQCRQTERTYDCNDYTHRHAFTFLSLLHIARNAKILHEGDDTYIKLTPLLLLKLTELDGRALQIFREDNPGITDLDFLRADFPFHTLSPITPTWVPPSTFEAFALFLKSLDERDFAALCQSCKVLLSKKFEDTSDTLDYFNAWQTFLPEGVNIPLMKRVIVPIAKNYVGAVDQFTLTVLPNWTYHFDSKGVGAFTHASEVPSFLHCQGNFASIICKTFIPHKPESRTGSCGVNSFLLGRYGPNVYREGRRDLAADINQFREEIVDYAQKHLSELLLEFGGKGLNELIAEYGSSNKEWTGREVWSIAARLYERRIHIFNCDGHEGRFRTNSQAIVTPFDEITECFGTEGDPINLLLYGPHYVFLETRKV